MGRSHHLVHRAGTDGIAGVPGFKEDLLPFLGGLACPEQVQFCAVGGEFSHGEVVKFKDILNELLGGGVKDPLLTAPVHHHFDLFLADLLLVGVGVHPQQTEDAVGGGGEHRDHRGEDGRNGGDQGGQPHGQGL